MLNLAAELNANPQQCRYCEASNPWVYFAPRQESERISVVCYFCAEKKNWLDGDGNLRSDVTL